MCSDECFDRTAGLPDENTAFPLKSILESVCSDETTFHPYHKAHKVCRGNVLLEIIIGPPLLGGLRVFKQSFVPAEGIFHRHKSFPDSRALVWSWGAKGLKLEIVLWLFWVLFRSHPLHDGPAEKNICHTKEQERQPFAEAFFELSVGLRWTRLERRPASALSHTNSRLLHVHPQQAQRAARTGGARRVACRAGGQLAAG